MKTALRAAWVAVVACCLWGAPATAAVPFGDASDLERGRFRALIAWVADYDHWTPLSAPKRDAERIAAALTERYLFSPDDVDVIGNPTQAELFTAIKGAAVRAGADDSLLIFFAGHGTLERETGQGYWIPKDGKPLGPAAELSYLSSAWIRDVLKGSSAKHVLVVSDSCFSGALLASRGSRRIDDRYYRKMFQRRSFEALTSGALETVDDTGAPDGHSPFAYYLAQALEQPERGGVFDSQDVFQRVRRGVKELSSQTPLFGRLAGAPSDGGAFVFVSRADANDAATALTQRAKARASGLVIGYSDPATAIAFDRVNGAYRDKDYDTALRDGLRAKFCGRGHARGCALMGVIYDRGLGTLKRPDLARGFFQKALALGREGCGRDDEHSCYIVGISYMLGRAVAPDAHRAVRELQRACDLGLGRACHALGSLVDDGHGTAKDPTKAFELYDKACRAGEATACHKAGRALESGRGVRKDLKAAVAAFREACNAGHLAGCGMLGAMTLTGRGIAADVKGGAALIARGCEQGDAFSCTEMGLLHATGTLGQKLPKTALSYWKRACDSKGGRACALIARTWQQGRRKQNAETFAAEYYDKACTYGYASGCRSLGLLYDDGRGAISWDPDRARALFDKACKLGDAKSCKAPW